MYSEVICLSEFDDLFKEDNLEAKAEQKPVTVVNDDINYYFSYEQKKINLIMFIAYVVILFLMSFVSVNVYNYLYPGLENYSANIVVPDDPQISNIKYDTDTSKYTFDVDATLVNGNDNTAPAIWISIDFYDIGGNYLGTFYDHVNSVDANQTAHFTGSMTADARPAADQTKTSFGITVPALLNVGLNLAQAFIAAIAFLLLDFKSYRRNLISFFKNFKARISDVIIGFATVFVVLYVVQMLMQIAGITGTSDNETVIRSLFEPTLINSLMLFLLLCVFTPFVEETIFRKVVYNFAEEKLNYKWAIAISGVIFGLMHVVTFGDWLQSFPYIALGLVFGYFYYRSQKNVFVTMGMHFLNNFVTFTIYILTTYGLLGLS